MNDANLTLIEQTAQLFRPDRILMLLFGIACLVLLVKGITYVTQTLYRHLPSRRLLVSQIGTSLNFLIYIFGGLFLFYAVLQPPREMMLAATGSAAVALGLSLKDVVGSVIAGFILLFDRPFQVGDRVTFGEVYGEIRSIGLRAVRLVTLDDNEITIPNNRFMTDVVASANAGALDMMVVMDFHIALDADVKLARDILHEVVVTSRYVYLKKPVAIVLSEVAIAERLAVRLQVKAYVLELRYEKEFQSDVYLRGINELRKHGIKRPALLPALAGEMPPISLADAYGQRGNSSP
ncbi:MAG: mechanosensitive ion channel [Gammaproteobacteria bacterium]|nr:mechanosensitive ion channel [Gammaproteobacteria bacterium]